MHPGNEKQALLPARAKIITNKRGTAPGFHINSGNCELFFTPGVPSEMLAMLEDYILPALQERLPNPPLRLQRILNVFGLAEPEVESRILKAGLPEGVELAFAVEFSVVQVKLRATGPEAGALIDQAELRVRQTLGDNLFGYGGQTLAEVTASLFCVTELSLALAESCTGGLIAKLLTDQPGASAFLERSIVSYANSAKTSCLDVPAQLLEEHGAVSAECAEAMVTGLAKAAQTDITLAVTGIAGPGGGTAEKPVGCVYIAMQSDGKLRVERFLFPGNRAQVRLRTALTALDWLRKQANRSLLEPSFDVSPEGPQEVFQEGKP
ncbi:MAG: nicotinamide-nucleotide amidohydrolase family protein, partial [Desulfuromonadales bacterium]|nr:nicotinamide-nucleotide amidohydrolase family protein [Desulfuromonadales bacterium]